MTDRHAELDAALDRVIAAAREHLAAVKSADGRIDDDSVWQAYVTLNNSSHEYDELLLDVFGEVTPWEVEAIDPNAAAEEGEDLEAAEPTDPHSHVISVRQRRDYRVPSIAALLLAAEAARGGAAEGDEDVPLESVGEAVLELLQSGDGSLDALDVPELEPLDGLVAVAEVTNPLDLTAYADDDGAGPFLLAAGERIVGRLDEHPFADQLDEDLDDVDLAEDVDLDEDIDLEGTGEEDLNELVADLDEEELDEVEHGSDAATGGRTG